MSFRQQPLGGLARALFKSPPDNERTAVIVKDGSVSLDIPVINLVTGTVYSIAFTPSSTGVYDVIVDNEIIATFEIVGRSVFDFLQNIEDEALGSWEWNKTSKVMTLFRQDGSELVRYNTDDTLEEAFQRISL